MNNRIRLSLLQHDLGNPDTVRVAGFTPGEFAMMLLIPPDESLLKTLNLFGLH